jgi:16S rRNA (adenine1518-N6/adenine1519-N6)-dimethyltransferase
MSIAHPKNLFPFLSELNAKPLKSLSQNFLIDANIIRKIADSVDAKEGDRILEIGPGPGALTEEFLKRGAHVIAIEKDRLFARALERLQTDDGRLTVIEGDFLAFDLDSLSPRSPLKVAANIPYNIATPILQKLCEKRTLFSDAHLMVQKEMADRMAASPGSKQIGSLTLFLQVYAELSIAVKVSRNCFYPAPKVDSSVVRLAFREPPLEDPTPLISWIRRAYQQRRKMLRSTLGIQGPSSTLRPEALSLEDWVALFRATEQSVPSLL